MAITATSLGTGQSKSSETSRGFAPSTNATPGALVVVAIAADNAGTNGASVLGASAASDSQGNTWTQLAHSLYDPSGVAAGVCVALYGTYQDVGTLTTGDTITVDFGGVSTTAKAWNVYEFAGTDLETFDPHARSSDHSSTPDITTLNSLAAGEAVIVGFGREAANSAVDDSDTTNGVWVGTGDQTTGGSGTTNIGCRINYKIVTGPGTQQFDLVGSADWAACLICLREAVTEVDLVVQDSAHTHTTENVTLAQTHVLTVHDSIHGHTTENVALTQEHELVTHDSVHQHATENVALTQTHQLNGVEDTFHTHTTENVTLSTEVTLVVADSVHGHTTENVTLTQEHELVVEDSLHAHTTEHVTLTQEHNLVVHDSTHSHTTEEVALTQTHELAGVQDTLHAHSSENVVLTQATTLVVHDSFHGHVTEPVVLTQTHVLAVSAAVLTHTSEHIALIQEHNLVVADTHHQHTTENLRLVLETLLSLVIAAQLVPPTMATLLQNMQAQVLRVGAELLPPSVKADLI